MEGHLFVLTSPIVLPEFTNEINLSLKKLPTPGLYGFGANYVYNEKNELVFLYSDGRKNAIKYDIEKDVHRQIKSSKSIDVRVNDPIDLRIGIHLWIIGGTGQIHSEMTYYDALFTTTFWVHFYFSNKIDKRIIFVLFPLLMWPNFKSLIQIE